MFFDWLTIEQDFGYQLPFLGEVAYYRLNVSTGESGSINQPIFKHEGSHCDVVSILIRGSSIKMSGNPSRWDRLENLFGLRSVDLCVDVFNRILTSLNLPIFTQCTRTFFRQNPEDQKVQTVSDGAVIKELHITENKAVGEGNVHDYLRALSTQPYRNSVPDLFSNGCTVHWTSKRSHIEHSAAKVNLLYASVYDKTNDLIRNSSKIIKKFGENSAEHNYIKSVIQYCKKQGVVRFEQKLKSRYLQKHALNYWGLADYSVLQKLHHEFIQIDKKLQVNAMSFESISEQLVNSGIVATLRAANTTANYALQWMHGVWFDTSKTHIQTHRARLRKIGIDIALPCDLTKFSPIKVKEIREITVKNCPIPDWYQQPKLLRVA